MSPSGKPRLDWRTWSDNERERQVSPSSAIGGDYAPFIERYSTESALALEAMHAIGERSGRSLVTLDRELPDSAATIDVFAAPADGGPVLVYIHGGYWQELDRTFSRFAALALHQRGWGCVVVGYPTAPHGSIPTMIDACADAIRWTRAALLPESLVVCGSSAGAHLAACAAVEPGVDVDGLLLFSGVFDLEPLIGTSVNDALALTVEAAKALSPLNRPPSSAPTFIAWGENETPWFRGLSETYADYLRRCGTQTRTHESIRSNHFDVVFDLQDPESAASRWLTQFT